MGNQSSITQVKPNPLSICIYMKIIKNQNKIKIII